MAFTQGVLGGDQGLAAQNTAYSAQNSQNLPELLDRLEAGVVGLSEASSASEQAVSLLIGKQLRAVGNSSETASGQGLSLHDRLLRLVCRLEVSEAALRDNLRAMHRSLSSAVGQKLG